MASNIDISTYSIPVLIVGEENTNTYVSVQVSSNSALDADITVSLQQSSEDQLIDIADTSTIILAGENTVLIDTSDYVLDDLYIKVDVGSATIGELSISSNTKKKIKEPKASSAIFDTVTVAKSTAIKLLDANPNRLGYSVFNSGSQEVVIRYKTAAIDNTIDGYSLLSDTSEIFHDVNYIGEISSIRSTTAGNQTSDVKVMEW
jgi:hypothetical protein